MSIIGTCTRNGNGFTVTIRTLTVTAPVVIEPIHNRRGEKSPNFRVQLSSKDTAEIGASNWCCVYLRSERRVIRESAKHTEAG